jgi:hypothetical protein
VTVSRHYHFEFDHPVAKLWSVVSDTPRWGEASGFPRYQASESLQPDGRVRVFGKLEIAGMTLAWEEPPVNWIAERWFEQRRIFSRGPIDSMTTRATLEDKDDRSGLDLELSFDTRNLVGTLIARRLVASFENKIRALLETADQLIRAEQPDLFESNYRPSPETQARAVKVTESIKASPYDHGLATRLVEYINQAQEVDLWAMRPIAMARRWQVDTRDTIELFLQSVRSGLLESRWDILCPRCRLSKSTTSNIGELPRGVHCDACNIDFDSDFASNVELSFSPSPSIRAVEYGFFCRSGPGVTPHIKGQCSLSPGTSHSLPFESKLSIHGHSPDNEIHLVNDGTVARTIVIEEQSWLRDVLTAARATTMQAFRDLFSEQVLRPGDEVSIRTIAFVFTDLVGSSSLFSRIGDAAAYHLVREHFADLANIVRHHRGNIVKTVGDGIHAAFLTPDDALRAAIEMQRAAVLPSPSTIASITTAKQ